jgi:2-(1,2-epoxy-1,2-dihydrophenyl)acetyl-CoA isomerase
MLKIEKDMMSDSVLLEEQVDGLLTLTLNRPERRNALNGELSERLTDAVARAARDAGVRAVLIRGSGGTFCVGGDVKAMADGAERDATFEQRVQALRRRTETVRLLHEMPKPTIALIEGAAAGAGLSIALACDFRIAGERAKITTAFAKVGLSGDYGGTYMLTKLLGSAKARDLYINSPTLSGLEARDLGLIHRVVDDAEVADAASQWARKLASGPTITFGYMKQAINLAEGAPFAAVLDLEATNHIRCTSTHDHKEAASAFVQKRSPVFGGH